jgi:hypothetical protein
MRRPVFPVSVTVSSRRPPFFQNPGHVGIYVGGGNFVHCSSYRDAGVIVTPVDQSNYARRFVSAVRVIP